MAEVLTPTLELSTAVNAERHGPQLVVVGILGLIATILVLANRLAIRWPFWERIGKDDLVCVVASIVAFTQTAVLMSAVKHGLGRKKRLLSGHEIEQVEKVVYAANLLYVAALCLGKLAVAYLFKRLSPQRGATSLIYATLIYGCAGILIVSITQDLARPWSIVGRSSRSTFARWAAVEAMAMVLDCVLIIFPAVLVRGLNMGRSTKIAVVLGFAFRLPVVVLAALRLAALAAMDYDDFTFTYIDAEIYGQLEMSFNVVAATIPCLRIFLKGWNTSFVTTTLDEIDPEMYTRHSSVASPRRTPRQSKNSSACKSKRSSWRNRHDNLNEIFDGTTHRTESSISSERVTGIRQASAGSKNSITVQRSVDVDIN
ncbi:hypothetical protein Slin15195_G091470 [Septoria linicola]|uniref:Rhodopsin domain-containing protein n=1 Tax=Septoria linicola TaxID=215465 RepID=A0A9Q9B1G1_9PEZI|nr:hypothetical protein Slin14017_G054620 [Septoria linicola]USW55828.1 hypothetical protein Slin15195_G091470 [Septoria linicola]